MSNDERDREYLFARLEEVKDERDAAVSKLSSCEKKLAVFEAQVDIGNAAVVSASHVIGLCNEGDELAQKLKDAEYRLEQTERELADADVTIDNAADRITALQSRLNSAVAELRQCYRDDGCSPQEIEDQVSRFVVERQESKS